MPKVLSLENIVNKIFEKHGNDVEMTEYAFKCNKCGYTWKTCASSVMLGTGCKLCGFKKVAEMNKNTIEYVSQYLEERGCKFKDDNYVNNLTPIKIEFECGHIYPLRFADFISGERCAECARKNKGAHKRLSQEQIDKKLNDNNLKLISFPNGYKNGKSEIIYECAIGHIVNTKMSSFCDNCACKECRKENRGNSRLREKHPLWKGGVTRLKSYYMHHLNEWRKRSMEICGYKCVITGGKFDDIHHVYGFNMIYQEAVDILGLTKWDKLKDVSNEDIQLIIGKLIELHEKYLPGACISRKAHKIFHKFYGQKNNTPEQFEDFKRKVSNGEILIANN
jgi:hypothetical protein